MSAPCPCWTGPATLHSNPEHCCFRGPEEDYAPGKALPCGHDPWRLPVLELDLGNVTEWKGAALSQDGQYRWTLTRQWSNGPICAWAMLNPSKADGRVEATHPPAAPTQSGRSWSAPTNTAGGSRSWDGQSTSSHGTRCTCVLTPNRRIWSGRR